MLGWLVLGVEYQWRVKLEYILKFSNELEVRHILCKAASNKNKLLYKFWCKREFGGELKMSYYYIAKKLDAIGSIEIL
jgi:hypothetical protein